MMLVRIVPSVFILSVITKVVLSNNPNDYQIKPDDPNKPDVSKSDNPVIPGDTSGSNGTGKSDDSSQSDKSSDANKINPGKTEEPGNDVVANPDNSNDTIEETPGKNIDENKMKPDTVGGDDETESDDSTDADLNLEVGKEVLMPEVDAKGRKERKKETNKTPTTDVIPEGGGEEVEDEQPHGDETYEKGMPPKYPLKAESAETSAHDNEIGGCRDHPRATEVCEKCVSGNKCFAAEHESYTYSYCRRSCRHCDPATSSFHTYWRLRALSEFEPTWMLQKLEFYSDPQEKVNLVDNADKAYASSDYTGYKASFAFDSNNETAWYPSGWGIHDNEDDWIAYPFTVAVRIHGVRMVVDKDHPKAAPKKLAVEASDKMYGPFVKKWTIYNADYSTDKVYRLMECDVLWKRFEVDDGAWCYRLIAKLESWENARKSCEIEGGNLATIGSEEERKFITEEVGLCSHTWFGLTHTNQGYFWNDGSNSTYRNWKEDLLYSDVQKQTLNCAAMDPEGVWYNFHCSNKFYFVCRKRLEERPRSRPDLVDNAWPYPPEVPPVIFFAPNVTVPVINSRNLEPGIFPDANGKVQGEEEGEDDVSLSDIFYEQTVEHLKEKGLKPSEELEVDSEADETDFTQELNKIAINTSPGDFQNESNADQTKNKTQNANIQEKQMKDLEAADANITLGLKDNSKTPKPKPKQKGKKVPPPPQESNSKNGEFLPKIKNGKPVSNSGKKQSKTPQNTDTSRKHQMQLNNDAEEKKEGTGGAPQQKVAPKQGGAPQQKVAPKQGTLLYVPQHQVGTNMMYYVPDNNGSFTLMRPIKPGEPFVPVGNAANKPGDKPKVMGGPPPKDVPNPPKPKEEGSQDNDTEDSVGSASDQKAPGQSDDEVVKPDGPSASKYVVPIDTPTSSNNGSVLSRNKFKVIQQSETAAQEGDYSIMAEANKLDRKKMLSRSMFHPSKQLSRGNEEEKKSGASSHFDETFFSDKGMGKVTASQRTKLYRGRKHPRRGNVDEKKSHTASNFANVFFSDKHMGRPKASLKERHHRKRDHTTATAAS